MRCHQQIAQTRRTGPFRFTAFGNSGQGLDRTRTIASVLSTLGTDLHLLLGDQVYNYGEYEHYKPRIFDIYGDMMSSVPFEHAHGNHEASGFPNAVRDHFYVPMNGPNSVPSELNYSFDYGDVHFVSVNSGSRTI